MFSLILEGVLPVVGKINIEANTESEAIMLAERLGECCKEGVKAAALEIEAYPADFLKVHGVADITPLDPGDPGRKIWNRDQIEALLQK